VREGDAFSFWRAVCVCVCVCVCGGDVLSDFRPLGGGKDDVRVTYCLLSELSSSEQFVPKQI
jgi:hypothetical protein